MDLLRPCLVALFSANLTFFAMTAGGCGTDAIGVDDCRRIELARCAAAETCGLISDLGQCQSFYRDQCLHGLPLEERPNSADVDRCVSTIELAGECAKGGANTELATCMPAPTLKTTASSACDLVREPELSTECAFLIVDPAPPVPDAAAEAAPVDSGTGG